MICLYFNDNRSTVLSEMGKAFKLEYVQRAVHKGYGVIFIWESSAGSGPSVEVSNRMKAVDCLTTLNNELLSNF